MNQHRHRRLRARVSILAIVALLWSQFVLASHPAASMSLMALAEATAATEHGCEHPKPADDEIICNAHCSQNDQRSDIERVSSVPALLRVPAIAVASILTLGSHTGPVDGLPPPVSWHRPTSHPASLLLI